MSIFVIEVQCSDGQGGRVWKELKPTGVRAVRYEWPTYQKAERIQHMCYPDYHDQRTRIREVV